MYSVQEGFKGANGVGRRSWGRESPGYAYFTRSSSFDAPTRLSSRTRPMAVPVDVRYGRSSIGPPSAYPSPRYVSALPPPSASYGYSTYRGPRSASVDRSSPHYGPVASVTERFERLYSDTRRPATSYHSTAPLAHYEREKLYGSRYDGRRGSDESSEEGKDSLSALHRHDSHSLYQSHRGATSMPDVPRVLTETRYSNGVMRNGFSRADVARSSGSSAEESTSGGSVSSGGRVVRRKLPPTPSPEPPVSPSTKAGLLGLQNIGNTCFMNSMLQCLSQTRPLRDLALSRPSNASHSKLKGAVIRAFSELVEAMWSRDRNSYINTADFKAALQKFAPRFSGYSQHDSQEFLRYMLWGLHEDLNEAVAGKSGGLVDDSLPPAAKAAETWSRYLRIDNSPVVRIFVGQLRSDLKCTHCGFVSSTFDPFWDLSLPIPSSANGDVSLAACLAAFTKEEVLDGDEKPKCEKCKTHRKCTKKLLIQRFPQILVLHLKRFSGERYRSRHSGLVTFPMQEKFGAFAAEGAKAGSYSLYAVSNHSGTPTMGHYTAYCRHAESGGWHLYDDSRVAAVAPSAVVTAQAYVLFYEQD